jgi:hypothetical protein
MVTGDRLTDGWRYNVDKVKKNNGHRTQMLLVTNCGGLCQIYFCCGNNEVTYSVVSQSNLNYYNLSILHLMFGTNELRCKNSKF